MTAESWYPLLGLVIFIGAVFKIPWLIYVSTAVGLVVAVANLWRKKALDKIIYRRKWIYRRGFPGETTQLQVQVENKKWLPVSWLKISDPWPMEAAPTDTEALAPSHIPNQGFLVNLYNLRWFQKITRTFEINFKERGVFTVGPPTMESGDLFGMFEESREVDQQELITVFPELLPVSALKLPSQDPFGDIRTRRRIFEDPNLTIGVQPYHPEDDIRRIHWPATARTGDLQVRLYQPVSARVLVVCLNVSTMEYTWMGTVPLALEQLVRLSATVCYQALEDGYSVGLFSNGCLAHSDQPFHIRPGRTQEHLALLLQALAGVTPFANISFEDYLLTSMPKVPLGSSLVIITALVLPALVENLLALKRYRTNITLISLAKESPPELPGIHCVHLPFNE